MTKTKHTPGPWRIGDAGMTIFGPPNGNPAPEVIATLRKKTNGPLIAAAPELLKALKALYEHCAMVHKHWGDGSNQREADNAIKSGFTAIAKAEGRE